MECKEPFSQYLAHHVSGVVRPSASGGLGSLQDDEQELGRLDESVILDDVRVLEIHHVSAGRARAWLMAAYIQVLQQVDLELSQQTRQHALDRPSQPSADGLTMITRSSLLGRSASLTFFTATVSPVPQFKAR